MEVDTQKKREKGFSNSFTLITKNALNKSEGGQVL